LHTNRLVSFFMSDTREYIIDQAFTLFIGRSYEAVSISDISKVIGMTKGALYHHFASKEELFRAVVDKYFNITGFDVDVETISFLEFNEICIAHTKHIAEMLFGHAIEFAPIDYMSFVADSFRHYPSFADNKIKMINSDIEKVKQVLDRAITTGEIRSDIDTQIVAQSYYANVIGLAGNVIQNFSIDKTIEMLTAQFEMMYHLLKK